jgi:hypothetical protein
MERIGRNHRCHRVDAEVEHPVNKVFGVSAVGTRDRVAAVKYVLEYFTSCRLLLTGIQPARFARPYGIWHPRIFP